MADRAIVDKIIQALAEYLKRDASTIKAAHHLRDDLGLDSMAVIELLYKIEETFDLQIPDQDLVGLATVGAVASYVEGRLAPAKPAAKKAPRPTATKSPTKRKAK
jgi:acyl carrier protein